MKTCEDLCAAAARRGRYEGMIKARELADSLAWQLRQTPDHGAVHDWAASLPSVGAAPTDPFADADGEDPAALRAYRCAYWGAMAPLLAPPCATVPTDWFRYLAELAWVLAQPVPEEEGPSNPWRRAAVRDPGQEAASRDAAAREAAYHAARDAEEKERAAARDRREREYQEFKAREAERDRRDALLREAEEARTGRRRDTFYAQRALMERLYGPGGHDG